MLPMFIILFYSSLYAHNLGFGYMQEQRLARNNAWVYAMTNCNETGTGMTKEESEVLPPVDTSGDAAAAVKLSPLPENVVSTSGGSGATGLILSVGGPIMGALAKIVPNGDGSQSTATLNLSWRLPNLYAGGGILGSSSGSNSTTITQIVTIPCNVPPSDGGAINAVIALGTDILSLF